MKPRISAATQTHGAMSAAASTYAAGRSATFLLGEETIRRSLFERFPDAVSATITEPDHGIRAAIVRAKAEDLGLRLSEEEMDLIARQISGSLRNIHGVLNRINLYRSFPDAFPDAPTVEEIVCSINS